MQVREILENWEMNCNKCIANVQSWFINKLRHLLTILNHIHLFVKIANNYEIQHKNWENLEIIDFIDGEQTGWKNLQELLS